MTDRELSLLERAIAALGRAATWLIVPMVLISTGNAVTRKLFDTSSNSWLETQWYLFGAIFLLAGPWVLLRNEHIRVDILHNLMPDHLRRWIDIIGLTVLILPFCLFVVVLSLPYAWAAWETGEQSANAGGLPLWPVKALIPVAFAMMALAVVERVRGLLRRQSYD